MPQRAFDVEIHLGLIQGHLEDVVLRAGWKGLPHSKPLLVKDVISSSVANQLDMTV